MGRRIFIWVLSPLLIFFLFVLAIDWGAANVIAHPSTVKKILRDSGIYSSVVPNVLAQTGQISTAVGDISITDPSVEQAVEQAVPPTTVQKNVEVAIDNVYQWLDGKITQPTFDIDLAGSQADFAKSLAALAGQRLASLPTCTTGLTATSFDALNATCLPPGVNAKAAADELQSEIASNDTLSQAHVSASDIKGNRHGQSIFADQLRNAPVQYRRIKKTPIIMAVLVLLTAAVLIWLRPTWQSGLRHVGTIVLIVGILMLVFAWLFNRAITTKIMPDVNIDNAALQTDLRQGITDLSQQIEHNYYLAGGVYVVVGAGLVVTALAFRPRLAALRAETKTAPSRPARVKQSRKKRG